MGCGWCSHSSWVLLHFGKRRCCFVYLFSCEFISVSILLRCLRFASVSRALAGEIAFKNGDLSFNLPYMSLMVCCGIESTLKEWCLNVFFYRSNCFIFFCMWCFSLSICIRDFASVPVNWVGSKSLWVVFNITTVRCLNNGRFWWLFFVWLF